MRKRTPRRGVNRREFLATTTTAVAGFTIVPRHVLGGPGHVPPSERVNIAIVGCGGQGRGNARQLMKLDDVQIVAVADPRGEADYASFYYKGIAGRRPVKAEIERHYQAKAPSFRCKEYVDFREMLDEEKGIDAVLVATPDHMHAPVSIRAMRAGKHVYCEKPLAHNVWECRMLAKVAKETGVATQLGNQGHSGKGIRETVEWLRAGAIGAVREIHAWSDTGRWVTGKGRPEDTPPVPEGFAWNLWLGPRDGRPYHPDYAPYKWRGWWEFGCGAFGDMGCHNIDNAVWAFDLDAPTSVEAYAPGGVDRDRTPYCGIYHFHFPERDDRPALRMTWYDGGLRPPVPELLAPDEKLQGGGNGTLFVGDEGVISCGGWGGAPRIFPKSRHDAFARPKPSIPRVEGHHRDWIDACKGGRPACSDFAYGARLTEIILLGNVALRAGTKLWWDAESMKATNAPAADEFLCESYRPGFEID